MSTKKTEVQLKINGREFPALDQQVLNLTVSKEVNKIPYATIFLRDGAVDQQSFAISNEDFFVPGTPIEIFLGTTDGKERIFKGIITKHSIKVYPQKPSTLMLECRDEAVKLSIGRKSRFFSDKSDSDIFNEILSEYSELNPEVEESSQLVVHQQMVQYLSTDWDFISIRAESLGKYIFVDDSEIKIAAPDLAQSENRILTYGNPQDSESESRIWEFESEIDARYQYGSVETTSWNYSTQELDQGVGNFSPASQAGNLSSGDLSEVVGLDAYTLHQMGRRNNAELTAYANSILQKSVLNKLFGRVKIDGNAIVKPGDLVKIQGLGDRFNGKIFVSRVHHSFEPGRWFTNFQLGMTNEWFYEKPKVSPPPNIGMLPPIHGLHLGKVIQLKDDQNPDPDFRIKINIPGLHQNDDGIWARYGTPYGGNQRGFNFLPEIDDEVIVGYIGDDAREPVILGSLYSQANPSPLDNDDNNFLKGIITANEHKITFDEENNVLSIETQGGNSVVLDDQNGSIKLSDSNNNVIEMNSGGITLSNSSTIKIQSTNIELEGTNVNIVGNAATNINSPSGGVVKLGNGTLPAAPITSTVTHPLGPGTVNPGPNTKVLI
ncbi:MAG: type VI secretion system tip protein VgrG [Bacteroidia bacterium]|nr:type VI secretion system tip protein VgrG [Bacteroidia bacterium]